MKKLQIIIQLFILMQDRINGEGGESTQPPPQKEGPKIEMTGYIVRDNN